MCLTYIKLCNVSSVPEILIGCLVLALGSALSTLNYQTVQHTRTFMPSYYCHELVYDAILLSAKATTLQDTVTNY